MQANKSKPDNQSPDTVWQQSIVKRSDREKLHKHRSIILWFTGLSGSGKSTLAHAVEEQLHNKGCSTLVLDGDNVRHGLCNDLGFSAQDRSENIRRIGELTKILTDAGIITLAAFISPFKADREIARSLVPEGDFLEIYCECPLQTCEQRDTKGLYKKARLGEIPQFTGISSPYEAPESPDLIVNTHRQSITESTAAVINLLATTLSS